MIKFKHVIVVILFLLFSTSVRANETKCIDVLGDVEIIAKISSNKYDVTYGNVLVPRTRMVLIAERSQYSSPGRNYNHMWIEDGKPEFVEITINGFSKKIRIIRESL